MISSWFWSGKKRDDDDVDEIWRENVDDGVVAWWWRAESGDGVEVVSEEPWSDQDGVQVSVWIEKERKVLEQLDVVVTMVVGVVDSMVVLDRDSKVWR